MRRWPAVLVLLPACGFSSSDRDGSDGPLCYGSYLRVCFSSAADVPVAPVTLPQLVDTDGPACDQHNDQAGDYCVVAGAGVTVPQGKPVRAFGSRPLILLSTTTVALIGTVNASSARVGTHPTGAGADPAGLCTGATPADHSSGGFGGSLGGKGGDGEPVDTPRGKGGVAAAGLASFPPRLRGGCPGGAGSTDTAGARPGVGGSGGGAVLVIAQAIEVIGGIDASGAGGRGGGADKAGAGGGGSGGMIVLDAPSITGTGSMFANGGGGGEAGSSGPAALFNGPGSDGLESGSPFEVGIGGISGRPGGRGGNGAAGTRLDGNPALGGAMATGGGGGGGGSAGFIHAPGLSVDKVSPPSTDLP